MTQTDTLNIDTLISAVVVYLDRARVCRRGKVMLEPGSHRLLVSGLPLCLDQASVRASARGTARARLLGVDVYRDFYVETPAENVRDLEQQIEAIQDEMRAFEVQAGLLNQEQAAVSDLLGQNRAYARGLAAGETTPSAYLDLLDKMRSRGQEINAALSDLEVNRRGKERRLQKLNNDLEQVRAGSARERYSAVVEVGVIEAGELTLDLTYVVSEAGWQPMYDLRLIEEDETSPLLEVGYLSQVTQRTGEDWTDVALTLSTARPALAEVLPELDPWYIEPVRPAPAPPAFGAGMLQAVQARMPAAISAEMEEGAPLADLTLVGDAGEYQAEDVTTRIDTSGASVTYQVPVTVTIPSDGAPHKAAVTRFEMKPQLDYSTAPKLVEVVYRRARVTNDSPYVLLPGLASLFAGDEFIGTTRLELIAPQGEIELYLGVDDRVKVKRELKLRQVDKRLIGNKRQVHYAYEILLENLLRGEIEVKLQDQLPVSLHEDVRVKLDTIEPEPTEKTDLNQLTWDFTMTPGQKMAVRFGFSVDYPRDMLVSGLP